MARQPESSGPSGSRPSDVAAHGWWRLYFLSEPASIVPWICAGTSISSLLLYLSGMVELRAGAQWLLLPGVIVLIGSWLLSRRNPSSDLGRRISDGCWAGLVATFAYDIVRVPMVMSGVPVFKAISYFGTVFLGEATPTMASEIVGWSYHLSNGVGFALMYVLFVQKPHWLTAVLWGLLLEGVMLLTPYAEVFGYKISKQFLSITIFAHVVYGLALWAALRFRATRSSSDAPVRLRWRRWNAVGILGTPLGLAAIAWHFHSQHSQKIPPSPPEYVGPHLYTTWDVLEPDRMASVWIWTRFVDKEARFHYQPAFSRIVYGKPFDVPEAEVRRTGTRSATEVLIAQRGLESNARLGPLAMASHLSEITPWQLGSDVEATRLVRQLEMMAGAGTNQTKAQVSQRILSWLDDWYSKSGTNGARLEK